MSFWPLGFSTSGASATSYSTLIKKISDIAYERRGHDKRYFRHRWTVDIAMTLAKRGAQVAIRRSHKLSENVSVDQVLAYGAGPLGDASAENPMTVGCGRGGG